jgi:predicted transcriptional regulator
MMTYCTIGEGYTRTIETGAHPKGIPFALKVSLTAGTRIGFRSKRVGRYPSIWYTLSMTTKLFDEAIAKARELPDEEQDTIALVVLTMAEGDKSGADLDDETRAAIHEGLEQARRGEFVSDEEIEALWKRHGL